LLILLGHALKRLHVLHPAHVPILNGLVINVTFPALIVLGLLRAPVLSPRLALLPPAIITAEIAVMALAFGAGKLLRLPPPLMGAVLMTGVFGNTGFIGYPLTLALLPREFPATIILDQFGMTVPMYLAAAILGSKLGGAGGGREAIARFLRSPIFLSAILGLTLRQIPVPTALAAQPILRETGAALLKCLEYLGQGTTPLVLLALGVALHPGAVRGRMAPLLVACSCKLLLCPLVLWGIFRLLGIGGGIRMDGILESAMPTAVMASVLSGQNDLEGDFAIGVVFVSTVLSAITVPILLTLLR
jgi:predicted permease